VAKYESPSGKRLQDDGVTPNVVLASAADEEPDVEEEAPPATTSANATAPVKKQSMPVDEQLTKALDILKAKTAV